MMLGMGPVELVVILIIYATPLAVVAYLLKLLVRFLKLSIGEMEERARVRKDKEPEAAEMRRSLSLTLREQREACGMTQEFVAHSLGVSRQAVSKWENGSSDPSTTNLIALAELYEVDPAGLIKGIAQGKKDS